MKKVPLLCLVAGTAMLTACATTTTPSERQFLQGVDQAYIDAVERHAAQIGTEVHWINPPRRTDRQSRVRVERN